MSAKRVTLTKGQVNSVAGKELLALLVDITADGELSLGEVERLREWLAANATGNDLPAVSWLRELIDEILEDGRITPDERIDLVLGIERVLPPSERLTAQANRERATEVSQPDADQDHGGDYEDPATEPQLNYIATLGGSVASDISKSEASETIDRLLNGSSSVSNRQMMVLRFWNRVDVASQGRQAVSAWMDEWYEGDSNRQAAWTLWKEENSDSGRQDAPSKIELGLGDQYLKKVGGGSGGCLVFLIASLALGAALA